MSAVLDHPLWLDEVTQRWREVLADKSLQDLPFKIETNRSGQIVMSPAKSIHARFQGEMAAALKQSLGGVVFSECPIATPEGVKVADVAWSTAEFAQRHIDDDVLAIAPEICVEIKSPSNAAAELLAKVRLYLDAGAKEVWLVDEHGRTTIHDRTGLIARSSFGIDVPVLK
jgi:Uma2 family endonuclease